MSGRHRDIGRQFASGNAKRKAKNDKEKKNSLVVSQTRKVTEFFAGQSPSAQVQPGTADVENSVDNESSESEQEFPIDPPIAPTPMSVDQNDAHGDNSDPNVPQIETAVLISSDLGTWPETINSMNQDYWIQNGSATCQHVDADFSSSKQVIKGRFRLCPKSIFTHEHKLTKETSKRSWLCYSPAKSSLFCFTCKVMNVKGNQFAEGGFNDWNNAVQRVQKHEQSPAHRDALISILNRQNERQRVDCQLTKELKDEKEYWTQVLERIVAVISFIAERGLAFRGDEEIIGSAHNGNYLGILELLAKFDPFLQEHIKNYAHKGKGTTSYLSHSICDEFIALLAQEVLAKIVDELKTQKFFSVSLDSTPDITHVDQLTLIVRYVLPSGPVERFVKFLSMEGHSADQMYQSLRSFFDEHGIDTKYLRGQS